jgi:hypothetical protein
METSGVESFGTNLAVGKGYADLHPPRPGCWLEVCRVQPWDGSPDVAGVSVRCMFNLFIRVSLIITNARNIHTPDMPRHGLSLRTRHDTLRLDPSQNSQRLFFMKRTLLAIQYSAGSFLSASFVFCIAMLLASLLFEIDDKLERKKYHMGSPAYHARQFYSSSGGPATWHIRHTAPCQRTNGIVATDIRIEPRLAYTYDSCGFRYIRRREV